MADVGFVSYLLALSVAVYYCVCLVLLLSLQCPVLLSGTSLAHFTIKTFS